MDQAASIQDETPAAGVEKSPAAAETPAVVEDSPAITPEPAVADALPAPAQSPPEETQATADGVQHDAQQDAQPDAMEAPAAQPQSAAADVQEEASASPEASPSPNALAEDPAVQQQAAAEPARQQTGAGKKKGVVLIKVGTQWVEVLFMSQQLQKLFAMWEAGRLVHDAVSLPDAAKEAEAERGGGPGGAPEHVPASATPGKADARRAADIRARQKEQEVPAKAGAGQKGGPACYAMCVLALPSHRYTRRQCTWSS